MQCCRPQRFRNISLDPSYNPITQTASFLPHSAGNVPFRGYKDKCQQIPSSPNPWRVPVGSLPPTHHPTTTRQFWALFLDSWCWCDGILTLWQLDSAITGSASVGYVLAMTNLSPGCPVTSSTSKGKLPLKNKAAAAKNQIRQPEQD